jgi:hypothetical protein
MGELRGRIKPPAFVLEYWNERKDKDKRDYYGTPGSYYMELRIREGEFGCGVFRYERKRKREK